MVPLPARKKNRNRPRRLNGSSRLFESNGPDIKIKGSAIQIVEKYQALSREYQTSGDPISAESCLQHAEHYQRVIQANELKSQKNQTEQMTASNLNDEVLKSGIIADQEKKETPNESVEQIKTTDVIPSKLEEQVIGK
tara:strand:- start:885 stop:1298 length:414 start_codon:yes stop_codon:yes gene_type:complete